MALAPDGRLWIAWQDLRSRDSSISHDVFAASSVDGRCSCREGRLTEGDAGAQHNPSIAVDAAGRIHAAWRDERLQTSGNDREWDIYYNVANSRSSVLPRRHGPVGPARRGSAVPAGRESAAGIGFRTG